MNPENENNYIRLNKKFALIIAVILLILVAGLVGWFFGRSDSDTTKTSSSMNTDNVMMENNKTSSEVSQLIEYELPDGWEQNTCKDNGAQYIAPQDSEINCGSTIVAPIKISSDPAKTKDCNELQNVTDVKKHVCISLYINGLRSLKASTEYLESSSYKQATTINAYYVDTGKGVAKVEYMFTSDNQYQATFDQLVNSITAKK